MAVVEVHTHKMLTHFLDILTKFHFLEYFHPNFYQSFHFVQTDGDDIPGIGQYEDFHTIDWQRDIARDRMRHRYIVKKVQDSIWDFLKVSIVSQLERIYVNIEIDIFLVIFFLSQGAHDAWSGWLCVLLVGIFSGCVAGVIDIGASWMTDLKLGVCPQAFWLNREQCCWSSNEIQSFDSGNCSQVTNSVLSISPVWRRNMFQIIYFFAFSFSGSHGPK